MHESKERQRKDKGKKTQRRKIEMPKTKEERGKERGTKTQK